MRPWLRLVTFVRCQRFSNALRTYSTVTQQAPFLDVLTKSTIVGRPYTMENDIFVAHPVYTGWKVLIQPPPSLSNLSCLVEVEVAPLGFWLVKKAFKNDKRMTVREYFEMENHHFRGEFDLDKVYLFHLENHLHFFMSVIPVGKVKKTIPSIRPTDVWNFGRFEQKDSHSPSSARFKPDNFLEPEKPVDLSSLKVPVERRDLRYFYHPHRHTFAKRTDLLPQDVRKTQRQRLISEFIQDSSLVANPTKNDDFQPRIPTERDMLKRRDFRSELVFSIDPPTALDLDDALHFRKLNRKIFEIGVHIADVSFYVPAKSDLCNKAMLRGTSFYLGDAVIPMLPPSLSDDLCSLHPGSDKLTLSVVFTMNAFGDVLSYWIGESIISSAAKISYTQADQLIDSDMWPSDLKLFGTRTRDSLIASVRHLQRLSVMMRKKRIDRNALIMNTRKIEPVIADDDPDSLIAFAIKLYGKSSILIEEFMLLANMTVAHFLQMRMPYQALLRRHPDAGVSALVDLANGYKRTPYDKTYDKETVSAQSLKKLVDKLFEKHARLQDETSVDDLKQTLTFLTVKSMYPAQYVIASGYDRSDSASRYFHFGLQVPLYTHFTSPIRRFADLVVHYQVKSLLQMTTPPDRSFLYRSVHISNLKRTAARRLSRKMTQYHVWNALMAVGAVLSTVRVIEFNSKRIKFYCSTFEVAGCLFFDEDTGIQETKVLNNDHILLKAKGCYTCKKSVEIHVKPLTTLHCFLSPSKNFVIKATLAHTIICPKCRQSSAGLRRNADIKKDCSDDQTPKK